MDRVKGWNVGDTVWLATSPDEVVLRRNGNDLQLGFLGQGDALIVENWFTVNAGSASTGAPVITFRDGSTWTGQGILDALTSSDPALSANNFLIGTGNADTLDGGDGADRIVGNGGIDTLIGEASNAYCFGAMPFVSIEKYPVRKYSQTMAAPIRRNGERKQIARNKGRPHSVRDTRIHPAMGFRAWGSGMRKSDDVIAQRHGR